MPLSYSWLMSQGLGEPEHVVELPEGKFLALVRAALRYVEVDEAWYRSTYRDVDQAIEAGEIKSAKEHYITAGYFEDRFPARIEVDEMWYFSQYTDVCAAKDFGQLRSAQHHFTTEGFKEGRLPYKGWSLFSRHPEMAIA